MCFCFRPKKLTYFRAMIYGKIHPRTGGWKKDYLLFKQIVSPMWPLLQRPLNLDPLQMFKSPREGIEVLLRNKQLLGQNSLWIPGWTASSVAETVYWLASRHAEHPPGSKMLGWFRRLLGSSAINSNKLVLNVDQALAECTDYGQYQLNIYWVHKRAALACYGNHTEKNESRETKYKWWESRH